ncbi:Protein of unknown function [Thiothrix caldifontis]|uniref:DUF3828 domain-containing protein n=1 Tax=Thiothrix caldifontis TaxID=525918 RepID=A0A1H4A870_9GAMM|nr:DUF3828 domain-containing protein [Thiothrix caldifontis]SEA32136.1 Protein of unknown function [Thiothrix caldifontis]
MKNQVSLAVMAVCVFLSLTGCATSTAAEKSPVKTVEKAVTAADTVRGFYERYFAAAANNVLTPDIAMSKAFKADIQKSEQACKGHNDEPCGWGADANPYLNSQDYDDKLSYASSGIRFKETAPNTVRVDLNVTPSAPQVFKNTIVFKMVREDGQWVADDILYPEGKSLYSTRKALADERASLSKAVQTAQGKDWRKGADGREVDCSLKVKGKTYLNGTCMYDADKDGSFRLFGDKYFVYLNMLEKGVAGASWNGTSQASHAQELLGEDFKLKKGCWVGKNAEICALDNKQAAKPINKAERIQFAKGASSATVTGKLADFDTEQNYVMGVGKGQTMTVEQLDNKSDGKVSIYITDPKGENANDMDLSCHSKATVKPTIAGDYKIQVVECKKADPWKGKYTVRVNVK